MKRQTGRPPAAAKVRVKSTLGMRVSPSLKERLNQEAEKNDRSLSAEAELRLEGSFLDEQLLELYDRGAGDLLRALGSVMRNTGRRAAWAAAGSFDTFDDWLGNPFARNQAIVAAITFLLAIRPKKEDRRYKKPKHLTMFAFSPEVVGQNIAVAALRAIADPDDVNKDAGGLDLPEEEQNASREAFGRRFHPSVSPLIERIPPLARRRLVAGPELEKSQ